MLSNWSIMEYIMVKYTSRKSCVGERGQTEKEVGGRRYSRQRKEKRRGELQWFESSRCSLSLNAVSIFLFCSSSISSMSASSSSPSAPLRSRALRISSTASFLERLANSLHIEVGKCRVNVHHCVIQTQTTFTLEHKRCVWLSAPPSPSLAY